MPDRPDSDHTGSQEGTDRVLLAHGGGSRLSQKLLTDVFRKHFKSAELARERRRELSRVVANAAG